MWLYNLNISGSRLWDKKVPRAEDRQDEKQACSWLQSSMMKPNPEPASTDALSFRQHRKRDPCSAKVGEATQVDTGAMSRRDCWDYNATECGS